MQIPDDFYDELKGGISWQLMEKLTMLLPELSPEKKIDLLNRFHRIIFSCFSVPDTSVTFFEVGEKHNLSPFFQFMPLLYYRMIQRSTF